MITFTYACQNAARKVMYTLLVLTVSALMTLQAAEKSADITSDFPGGLCLYIDSTTDAVIAAVKSGSFLVHSLNSADGQARSIRDGVAAAGVAPFVLAETWFDAPNLPYEKNHVTVMVVNGFPKLMKQGLSIEAVVKALSPLGKASLNGVQESDKASYAAALKKSGISEFELKDGCLVFQKPWQEGMGTWTHGQQGPDGQPVADDTYMGVPNQIQWITGNGPQSTLGRLISTRVGGGRAFYFYHKAIVARDAASGVILWIRPVGRPGGAVLTESGDIITRDPDSSSYVPVAALISGTTGKTIRKFGKSASPGPYENGIVLTGTPYLITAHDINTGKKLWEEKYERNKENPKKINVPVSSSFKPGRGNAPNSARLMSNGIFVTRYRSGEVVARNAKSGEVIWNKMLSKELEGDFTMHFIDNDKIIVHAEIIEKKLGKVGGGMVAIRDCFKGVLRFAAVSVKDGSVLWKYDLPTVFAPTYRGQVYKAAGRIWICRHKDMLPESVEASDDLDHNNKHFRRFTKDPDPHVFDGLNPETGVLEKTLTMPRQIEYHCYQLTVTDRYYTGNRPYYFVDWKTGKLEGRFGAVRSPCDGVGHFAAQGLWFARGGTGCACIRTVMAAMGAYSASDEPSWDGAVGQAEHPLIKGSADMPSAEVLDAGDWPMYRGDHARSAASKAKISDDVSLLWQYEATDKNTLPDSSIVKDWTRKKFLADKKVSQPTVANGRVFVSLLETKNVIAVDAATGKLIWNHRLPALADSSPTIHKGLALVGCNDGWVYALRADNGKEVWRLRIAPAERRIVACGQLESSWPVLGGVVVVKGTAYAIAGRTTEVDGGLYVLAFDAASGRVLWEGRRYLDNPGDIGKADHERYEHSLTGQADLLCSDGKSIVIGRKTKGKRAYFDAVTGKNVGKDTARYTSATFGTTKTWSGLFTGISFTGKDIYSATKPQKQVTKKGDVLLKKPGSIYKDKGWKISTEGAESKAIAVGAERMYVAMSDADKNELWILSIQDGKKIKTLPLPAPAVVDGVSLSNGKIHVALENSSVVCFGVKK